MRHKQISRIVFVTGTDTGVGKTTLTAMLLAHLRGAKRNALALKPFCSGSRADAELLWLLQDKVLPLHTVNPFFFPQPVAPLAVVRDGKTVPLNEVREKILSVSTQCEILLVEGAGGLLVPLGPDYTVADLIAALKCRDVLIVGMNKLGIINHILLTISHLSRIVQFGKRAKILLMNTPRADEASRSNQRLLRMLLPETTVMQLPYLGKNACAVASVKKNAKKFQKTLARLIP